VVRSYVFGDEYNALLRQLEQERRIDYADDLAAVGRLHYQPMDGLPMTESGAYVSRRSLPAADQQALRGLLADLAKGTLWRYFQQYYPPGMLRFAVVPH